MSLRHPLGSLRLRSHRPLADVKTANAMGLMISETFLLGANALLE